MIFSILAPFASVVSYLHYQKKLIRKEVKKQIIAGIDKDKLVKLKFSKEEIQNKLKWKHAAEFEFNGEMYDIVDKEESGDSIIYRCWWDNKETELNKALGSLVALATGKHIFMKEIRQNLFSFYTSLYCNEFHFISSDNHISEFRSYFYCEIFRSLKIKPPVPPPKAV